MNIEKETQKSLLGRAGLRVLMPYDSIVGTVTPEFYVGGAYEFWDDRTKTTATFVGGGDPFTSDGLQERS